MHSLLVLRKQGSWISSNTSTSQSQKHFFSNKNLTSGSLRQWLSYSNRGQCLPSQNSTPQSSHTCSTLMMLFFMLRFYNHGDVIIIIAKGNAIDLNVNTLMTVSVIPPLVLLGIFTLMSGSTPPLKLFMIIIIIICSSSSSSSTAAAAAAASSSNLCHQQTLSRNINIFPLHWCQRQALRLFVIKIILLVIISSWYQHIRISKKKILKSIKICVKAPTPEKLGFCVHQCTERVCLDSWWAYFILNELIQFRRWYTS